MNCPYCSGKLENGVVQSGRVIFWSNKKHKFIFIPSREGEFPIADGWNGAAIEAARCPNCKKIIINYE